MEQVRGGIVSFALTLFASAAFAQQMPPGQIAYTKFPLGGTDPEELWLINSDHTNDHMLSPQILYGGLPANVASLGIPVWSKDGRLIAANAILAPSTNLDPKFIQVLLAQGSPATPANILVVFDPTTNQGSAVFHLDFATGTATGLTSLWWINASFSPDGKRLVYVQQDLNYVEYGVINIDGTGKVPFFVVNLTENALGLGVDWSPRKDQLGNNGNLLVISYPQLFYDPTCLNIPRTVAALYLINDQGKVLRQLTSPPQIPCSIWTFDTVNDLWPVFSPDGTQVAFARTVRDSMGNVSASLIMTAKIDGTTYADGTAERNLLYLPGIEVDHLSWSPDGTRVMFDQTQMAYGGLYPIPMGVYTTSSSGSADTALFLNYQASSAAWGLRQ